MSPLSHPRPLRPGDPVAVVSPAGPVLPEHLAFGLSTLREWGLDVRVDPSVYARHEPHDYLAGADEVRLEALRRALFDPEIRAVICSRGGYGAMRLLPELHADLRSATLSAQPPLLVGFSDVTALHLWSAGVAGIPTLHAPVVKSFELQRGGLEALRRALFGLRGEEERTHRVEPLAGGRRRGRLLGGNLSLVVSLLASPYCPDLEGCILLLEDVGEEDYRLDRLFTTLRLAHRAQGLAGVVLGDFTGCSGSYVEEAHLPAFVRHLAVELAEALSCPAVAGFPSGHGPDNVAVPMGVEAEIDGDAGTLRFLSDAVAPADGGTR